MKRFTLAVVFSLMLAPLCHSQEPAKRLAVPDEAAQKEATQLVAQVFKARYEAAKTNPQKVELAKHLIGVGKETKDDDTERFVILRIAGDIAAGAGDVPTAFEAIDHLKRHYEISGVEMKLGAITKAAATARTPKSRLEFLAHYQGLIENAIMLDRYDVAKTACNGALSMARDTGSPKNIEQMAELAERVRLLETEFANVSEAKYSLDRDPTNAQANLTVGKFYCFSKGDWENGLLMLALCKEEPLKSLATAEIEGPHDALKLGDGWWSVAAGYEGREAGNIKAHAAHWYQKAQGLTGFAKAKVEQRLAEAGVAANEKPQETAAARPERPAQQPPQPPQKPAEPPVNDFIAGALAKKVSLQPPYPENLHGSTTQAGRVISVQYAVIGICNQIGLGYDFQTSLNNTDPLNRRWVQPNFIDVPAKQALENILHPLGLDYRINADNRVLVLIRKPGQ